MAERVNGILKDEFQLEQYEVDTKTMKKLVKESVNIYNTKRPHYSCYMLTPEQMHLQKTVKKEPIKKPLESRLALIPVVKTLFLSY